MKIIYTRHAEEKLRQEDTRKFKIKKKTIENILKYSRSKSKTKYGDLAALSEVDSKHDLRIIYSIIDKTAKVITFHISRKGRYK